MAIDLRQNAFTILGVGPTALPEELVEAANIVASQGGDGERRASDARAALLSPKARLDEELRYLLEVPPGELAALLKLITSSKTTAEMLILRAANLSLLARCNLIAHTFLLEPPPAERIISLLIAQSDLSPEVCLAAVNRARAKASIALARLADIQNAMERLRNERIAAIFSCTQSGMKWSEEIYSVIRQIGAISGPQLDDLATLTLRYSTSIGAEEAKFTSNAYEIAESIILGRATDNIDQYLSILKLHLKLLEPLRLFERNNLREDERSVHVLKSALSLARKLANEQDRYAEAGLLCESLKQLSSDLPRISAEIEDDISNLNALVEQAGCRPLIQLHAQFKEQSASIANALRHDPSLFEKPTSLPGKLLAELKNSIRKIGNSSQLPWLIARACCVELNEEGEHHAALLLIREIHVLALSLSAPESIKETFIADIKALGRSVEQSQLQTSVEGRNWSAAIAAIERLVATAETSTETAQLNALKSQIANKRAVGYVKYAIAAIVTMFIVASIAAESFTHPGPTSQRDTSYKPAPSPIPTSPPPTVPTLLPIEQFPEKRPDQAQHTFTEMNVRYCLYRKSRLEYVRGKITSNGLNERFNREVDDYNTVCSRFQYLKNDKVKVDNELVNRRYILQAQADQELSDWARNETSGSSPSLTSRYPEPTPQRHALPSTLPAPELAPPAPIPAPPVPQLNLLAEADVRALQTRLVELSYSRALPDGTWDSRWRSAMRAANIANGVGRTDRVDFTALSKLFSGSSANGRPGAEAVGGEEWIYPPPPGAALNPVNRNDAERIRLRLVELGFTPYAQESYWGPASRHALNQYKALATLTQSESWDALVEGRLFAKVQPFLTPADITFESDVGGAWVGNYEDCHPAKRSVAWTVTINRDGGSVGDRSCTFEERRAVGKRWEIKSTCRNGTEVWSSNLKLARDGNTLRWYSDRGSATYYKCPS